MAANTNVQPPQHSRRVEAWIYTVLNPLIDNLRAETHLLRKGNLTWRCHSKRCEYIRPVSDYIDTSYLPNYEDFLADGLNSGFKEKFEEHDRLLARVEATASEFFDLLMHSDMFRKQVSASLEEYKASAASTAEYTGLESMEATLPQYVAEYLINRTGFLPSHYTMHRFWQGYRHMFESLVQEFESHRDRPSFRAVQEAAEALNNHSSGLLFYTEQHRHSLSARYDVPFAPIASDQRP